MYLSKYITSKSMFSSILCILGICLGFKKRSRTIIKFTSKSIKRYVLKKYSPKALRVLKTNKAPVVLDKQFALKQKPYSDLDLETIKKRAN